MVLWQRHFPVAPMSAPRVTARSWHARAGAYKRWRDAVRILLGPPSEAILPPVVVRIVCLDWAAQGDPDNVAKAILDALQPWPLPRDSWRVISSLSVSRSSVRVPGGGFSVEIESWGGLESGVGPEAPESRPAARKSKRRGSGALAPPDAAGLARRPPRS